MILRVMNFGGVGGARRLLELLAVTPGGNAGTTKDETARRVSTAALPEVQHFGDIAKEACTELLGCAKKESGITDVIQWGNLPCRGLSGLDAGQTGMEALRLQLECVMNDIGSSAHAFPRAAGHSGAGISSPLNKNDRQAASRSRYHYPHLMYCPGLLSSCRQDCLCWLRWPVGATAQAQPEADKDHARLTFKRQRIPASCWLPCGHRILDSGARRGMLVGALPIPRAGFTPAGLAEASRRALKRQNEQSCRYLPSLYEPESLVCVIKEKKAVPLPGAVCKGLPHLGRDHFYLAMKTPDRKSNPVASKDLCWSLRGNSLQVGVCPCLAGQGLFQRCCLSRRPTASDVAGPATVPLLPAKPSDYGRSQPGTRQAWRERSPDDHLVLAWASNLIGAAWHGENPPASFEGTISSSSSSHLWKGRAWSSGRWKAKEEWFIAVEARPMRLLLEQKYRSRLRMNNKYLDVVCVTTMRGAFGRRRGVNRRPRYVINGALATRRRVQCGRGADFYGNFAQKCVLVNVTGAPGQFGPLSSPWEEGYVDPVGFIARDGPVMPERAEVHSWLREHCSSRRNVTRLAKSAGRMGDLLSAHSGGGAQLATC